MSHRCGLQHHSAFGIRHSAFPSHIETAPSITREHAPQSLLQSAPMVLASLKTNLLNGLESDFQVTGKPQSPISYTVLGHCPSLFRGLLKLNIYCVPTVSSIPQRPSLTAVLRYAMPSSTPGPLNCWSTRTMKMTSPSPWSAIGSHRPRQLSVRASTVPRKDTAEPQYSLWNVGGGAHEQARVGEMVVRTESAKKTTVEKRMVGAEHG